MKIDDRLGSGGVDARTMHSRAVSVARRLLGGSGRAELCVFRAEPQYSIQLLAHAMLADGTLVVAASSGQADSDGGDAGPIDVRLDIEKDAPEPMLRIRAATMHALGRLAWIDEAFLERPEVAAQLPEVLTGLAGVPGVRIGTLEMVRVLLHDCAGVTPLDLDEILPDAGSAPFPQFGDELTAAEAVWAMTTREWVEAVEGILTGRLPGRELTRLDLPTVCSHTLGSVRCVDVDSTGVTVMHFTTTHATTMFVPFAERADDLDGIRAGLDGLRFQLAQAGATS